MAGYEYRIPAPLMSPEITPSISERFWRKVDKTPGQGPKGDCWLWQGPDMTTDWDKNPYPRGFSIKNKSYRPSHVALAIDGKPRPSGEMQALHQCDTPMCVRPDHLRWGTWEENMQEARERQKYGPRCLSPDLVREIRASDERHYLIAKRLGVTSACIINIRKRVTHKHID